VPYLAGIVLALMISTIAFHGHLVNNPGVPTWWPAFCLTYDITAAAFLAWLLKRPHRIAPRHAAP
jgi:hypothetical protein